MDTNNEEGLEEVEILVNKLGLGKPPKKNMIITKMIKLCRDTVMM